MELSQLDKNDIILNQKSSEHGRLEIELIQGISDIYSPESRNSDYRVVDEIHLKKGLEVVLSSLAKYIDLSKDTPPDKLKAGEFHNSRMLADSLRNAAEELKDARASSASLIRVMPLVSEMARVVEKAEYFDQWYGIKPEGAFASYLYSRDLRHGSKVSEKDRNYAEKRRVSQEEYIAAVEQRVIKSAPRWEEEARVARLSKTEVDSKRS